MTGIGRTPIREAIQRLAREHLVLVLPQRGLLVSEMNVNKQLKLLEIRREIERLICREHEYGGCLSNSGQKLAIR
jgi:DNA-binding GntR family transcriptional regulator